ncbi:hypothetical protein ACFWZ2_27930 [Streptomyces sp. NPDC059002]|uniref:hypothetical protein n=1 Tax=Streptomyces sp. NPDC059002 TaxID=3346690 RepID=UPI0036B8EB04
MARKFVYLAIGRTKTEVYKFDPVEWEINRVDTVPAYDVGYTAMGILDETLYAVSQDNLVVIDLTTGTITPKPMGQHFTDWGWFCGEVTPDKKSLVVCSGPNTPVHWIDLASARATPGNAGGAGRWDDWSYHPKDGRLYAVEGDNGDLLYMDWSRSPVKVLLKEQVFPPAEQSKSGGRKSYSAIFFDEDGNMYAIDSKGNVNVLDLTASTESHPATPETIGKSQRIGDKPLPVDDLEVMNSAGRVDKIPVIDPPVIKEPMDQSSVSARQAIRGTVTGDMDEVQLYQVIDGVRQPLGPAILKGADWTYEPVKDWPVGSHEVLAVAHKGKRDSLPATVHFTVQPLAPPVITVPQDGMTVAPDQVIKGTMASGIDAVSLSEAGKPLGNAQLGTGTWTFTPVEPWSEGSHTVQAIAHHEATTSDPAVVRFTAKDLNLRVTQHFDRDWRKEWDKPQYIYSFTLTLQAKKTRVSLWTLSFTVPPDTVLDPDWLKTFSYTVKDDGHDGTVILQNTDPHKTIDPGSPLPLGVQVLFPGQSSAYQTLDNLTAHEDS